MEPRTFSSGSLEEYKTLRSEILRSFDAADKNILACITANGLALAYGAKESNSYILVFACMLPIYFWIQHALYRTEVAKLSAYIIVFLESQETGLMWETRIHRADLAVGGGEIAGDAGQHDIGFAKLDEHRAEDVALPGASSGFSADDARFY